MPNPAISVLAEAVQYNCHVSDARHGADDSLFRSSSSPTSMPVI